MKSLVNMYCLYCISALADIMKRLLTKYDNLFEVSFPYSMGWVGKLILCSYSETSWYPATFFIYNTMSCSSRKLPPSLSQIAT